MMLPLIRDHPENSPDEGGTVLVQAIARTRERFLNAGRALERRSEVRATRSAMDCRDYESGAMLEFYLEADVAGRTICWWLDAAWRVPEWEISASVLENRADSEYQEQLREFPVESAVTGASLAMELERTAAALLATTELAEFREPAI